MAAGYRRSVKRPVLMPHFVVVRDTIVIATIRRAASRADTISGDPPGDDRRQIIVAVQFAVLIPFWEPSDALSQACYPAAVCRADTILPARSDR